MTVLGNSLQPCVIHVCVIHACVPTQWLSCTSSVSLKSAAVGICCNLNQYQGCRVHEATSTVNDGHCLVNMRGSATGTHMSACKVWLQAVLSPLILRCTERWHNFGHRQGCTLCMHGRAAKGMSMVSHIDGLCGAVAQTPWLYNNLIVNCMS